MSNSSIEHKGIVQKISDNQLEIMILSESACSSCGSKKVCSISEIKEKLIYVNSSDNTYKVNDKVIVYLEEKMGAVAVIFAYVLPFIVMISILFAGYSLKFSEPILGISVLISVALYFVILYFFRNQFNKRMTFKVAKQTD